MIKYETFEHLIFRVEKQLNSAISHRQHTKLQTSNTEHKNLGTSGTLTSIETSKWKWLRQKFDGSPGSMRRGSFATTMSKRSSCSTIVRYNAGLKEQKHLSWYHDHKTPNMRQCNTSTQLPIVLGKLTHFPNAVISVNTGPIKRKHTNWTGRTSGRRLRRVNLAT